MRAATLLLIALVSGTATGAPPPELGRHCPSRERVAEGWEQGFWPMRRAAESGSVECLRYVLQNVAKPEQEAAWALSVLHEWHVGKQVNLRPVVEELMSRVDFGNEDSPAHAVLVGLVEYQEYDLLEEALKRGADPNRNEREDGRGETPLNRAAKYGDQRAIETLLRHGADINLPANGGRTPLHWAVGERRPATVAFLVKQGANADLKDVNGLTPWLCACGNTCGLNHLVQGAGNEAELARARTRKEILDLLAPVARRKPDQKFCNASSVSAGEALANSPSLKSLEEKLARDTPPILDFYDEGGWTPLNQTVFSDRRAALLLIHRGADVNIASRDGTTPLHRATEKEDAELVNALLQNGANPSATDENGRTPLHQAAWKGNAELVRSLLQAGADPAAADKNGETALSLTSSMAVAQSLARSGKRLSEESARAALFAAVGRNAPELASLIIEQGAPMRGCGPEGHSLLSYSLHRRGDPRLFWKLLDKGADMHERCPGSGNLLVQVLLNYKLEQEERRRIAMELLRRGADVGAPDSGESGFTPLIAAARRGDGAIAEYLLNHGADVNAISPTGNTALNEALRAPSEEMIFLLLERGADPNLRRPQDPTPLHVAVGRRTRVVESLLIYGANAEPGDVNTATPLQLALGAATGREIHAKPLSAVRLLQHGANPQPAGLLPLRLAIKNYHKSSDWKDLFHELIRRGALPVRDASFRPLHYAVSIKQTGAIPGLVAGGEVPSARDDTGKTAFQTAEEVGCAECLTLLAAPVKR